ncbi:unnamed protein product [Echinostoma caproni]|uniref:Uncharacterized protein n=1 Tax=Echinostoma caproni TaxID=27848 RepID=A0A183ARI7_9TREM|nr:unnamed protein product [Echinostoma caproni]
MEVPWPEALEDGDKQMYLEEFEDVAELAGSYDGHPSASQGPSVGGVGCGAKRPGEDGVGPHERRPDRGF